MKNEVEFICFICVAGKGIRQNHDGTIDKSEKGCDIWFIQGAMNHTMPSLNVFSV